jgi:hypothetical protein
MSSSPARRMRKVEKKRHPPTVPDALGVLAGLPSQIEELLAKTQQASDEVGVVTEQVRTKIAEIDEEMSRQRYVLPRLVLGLIRDTEAIRFHSDEEAVLKIIEDRETRLRKEFDASLALARSLPRLPTG